MNIEACNENIFLMSGNFHTMPNPTSSRAFLTKALFDLINVKTWKDMIGFVERYSPYLLPGRGGGFTVSDYVLYGQYSSDSETSHPKRLDGNIGNARYDFGLNDPDDLLRPLVPHAKALEECRRRRREEGGDCPEVDFDERYRAFHNQPVTNRYIVGVEKILRDRDMLSEALLMYSVAIGATPVNAVEEKFIQCDLGGGLTRVQYSCEWLLSRYSFPEIKHCEVFDGSVSFIDFVRMGISLGNESTANDCVYLFDQKREAENDTALLYGARMLTRFFINSHLNGLFDRYYQPEMGSSLHFETKHTPNLLLSQIWHEISVMADERVEIKTCRLCNRPMNPAHRGGYCSSACKTRATNKRREASIKYAVLGVPVDEAVRKIGERYRGSIEKWYAEVQNADPAR